jgi:hypothetical protein
MERVPTDLIKTIRALVDLERSKAGGDLYFEIVEAVALIFPRCIKEQLQQLVSGPVWDGNVICKGDRGILFEMGIATRVCCKGEQGYTGSKYIGYSILKKMKEQQNVKQEVSGMPEVPSEAELEKILNSEDDKPINIAPDGSVVQ